MVNLNTKEFEGVSPAYDFLDRILNRLEFWKIDLKELGADTLGSDWRNLRPYCNCQGTLSPEDETWNWYWIHAIYCLNRDEKKIKQLESKLGMIIIKEGKRFKKEKEQSWEIINKKSQEAKSDYKKYDRIKKEYIMNCYNKQELKKEAEKQLKSLEKFQKSNEKEIKEEAERIRQEKEKVKKEKEEKERELKEEAEKRAKEAENKERKNNENNNKSFNPPKEDNQKTNQPSQNQPNKENQENKSNEKQQTNEKKLSPEILNKFQSIPNFNTNTKEKIETLINPVKDNPDFLLELQTKQKVKDLNNFLATKTPKEIIILIKRFEYDKDKDKEIREYYNLKPNEKLTEKQINEYLYKLAIGEITASKSPEQHNSTDSNSKNKDSQILVPLIIGGGIVFGMGLLLTVIVIIKRKIKKKKK